jgi:threonine/homoserine/homoserine lactone efflux protein
MVWLRMQSWLVAVLGFAFAASVTPGPNNIMVASSAANHGLAATLPHMLGIALGFAAMFLLVGLGIARPLAAHPAIYLALRWGAVAWLLWLAVQIARAAPPGAVTGERRPPLGFTGGALFQWVNPKAWLLAIGGTASYVAPGSAVLPQVAIIAAVFAAVSLPCTLLWAWIGRGAGRVLRAPGRLRAFNFAMATLLVASVLPVLWGE